MVANSDVESSPTKDEETIQVDSASQPATTTTTTTTTQQHEQQTILSPAHQSYLVSRHGTTSLSPLPTPSDLDPYNWPYPLKLINLLLLASSAFLATFMAASLQSAFEPISQDLGITIQATSYLASLTICVLGIAPLFWRPLADRWGRRPVFLISLLGATVGNIGCAVSGSYGTMGLCRAITAFFISTPAAVGSAVVQEVFFSTERARYMGVWTMFVTLGVPVSPFIFGFVALRVSYRWIYWTLAIANGVVFVLYVLFGRETLYMRDDNNNNHQTAEQATDMTTSKNNNGGIFRFGRIDPKPLGWWDFVEPLSLVTKPCVIIPAVVHAMVFCVAGVLPTIEMPQVYLEEFGLNTQEVGLQNLAFMIGTLIGEQFGGFISDKWMTRGIGGGGEKKRNSNNSHRPAEFRLWFTYLGFGLAIAGDVIFFVCLGQAGHTWNVRPTVGVGFAAAGNQLLTTILITYAVDCYRERASSIGVFIMLVRQEWGFIGPFWFPDMVKNAGFNGSAGICVALIVLVSIVPTFLLQWKGSRWH